MALFSKLSGNVEVSEALNKKEHQVITENEIIDIIFGADILEDLNMSKIIKTNDK